ncbi:LCP family protein [Streptomyces luteolus]|uniref:LCP family protein n=1 Tax=Streptomyces luteolus TaxID=3043615 RepID=A0ABT6SW19_9ACTN|nr:LCP family protein [Streptomyces sp. B-S-A12]MDI3419596.1 LCP family protein [Streptomyces sp. B-S-A12]
MSSGPQTPIPLGSPDPYERYGPYGPYGPYEPLEPYGRYDPHEPDEPHDPYAPYAPYDPYDPDSRAAAASGIAGGGRYRRRGRRPRRRRSRLRRVLRALCVLVLLSVLGGAGTYVWADSRLSGDVDLSALPDRPAPGKGTNYLIVGSDSREGLSEKQTRDLHTGSSIGAEGRRTDSMMVLHTGAHGSSLVSLPRDSWVTVPAHVDPRTGVHHKAAKNKLNAAFSLGGPELLVRTVELNTGLRIDHYTEIGFAGFVGIVDAVDGVRMCVDRHLRDEKSGLDLTAGCHTLDGRDALAFVRQRHQEKEGDLGRSRNQQKFLAALAEKAASRDVLLSPSAMFGTAEAGLDTLVVDESTGLPHLTRLFTAMRKVSAGDGDQLNVPVAAVGVATPKGSAIRWDRRKADRLFTRLREDRPVTAAD